MLCSQLLLVKHEPERVSARVLTCRSWKCDLCRPERQKQLIAQAISGQPNLFITLTVNPARGRDPNDRARGLVRAWRTIRKLACKKYGYDDIPFLAVLEATEKGEPHLHILARARWLDQDWLSKTMAALTGAPVVWIEAIDNKKKTAAYVAKYCGKSPHRFGTCKRYWSSKHYELRSDGTEPEPPDPRTLYERRDQTIEAFEASLVSMHYTITREARWIIGFKATPPPRDVW